MWPYGTYIGIHLTPIPVKGLITLKDINFVHCWVDDDPIHHLHTSSKFTQKPRIVIVSECTHAHVAWCPLIYAWKKCMSLRKRQSSLEVDLHLMMCAFSTPRYSILTMLSLMKPRKTFDGITGTFVPPATR